MYPLQRGDGKGSVGGLEGDSCGEPDEFVLDFSSVVENFMVVRENFMVLKGVSRPGTPLITVSWGDP